MIFNMTSRLEDGDRRAPERAFNVSRAAANHFREQKWARFVNLTSTSGLIGNFGQANYAAAKMGIFGLSRSIALDMAAST